MRAFPPKVPALASLALCAAACFGGEPTTGVSGDVAAELSIQPTLIPSAADAGAAPINRIRTLTTRVPDGVVLAATVADVSATEASWTLDLTIPVSARETVVVVLLHLINVANDGTESVQFSGRSDPITLVVGQVARPAVTITRGPIANLLVTGVTITSASMVVAVGATRQLSAAVTTSELAQPTVFWTSLQPGVVSVSESTATAVAPGTALVVASAGAFSDTVSITVTPPGLGQIVGVVLDAVTSQVIASASVSLSGGNVFLETSTGTGGAYAFPAVPAGTYVVLATADGYVANTAANLEVVAVGDDVVRADFALPPLGSFQRFAGLSGRVTDSQGNPLAGASVGISGGAQTNGVFKSTSTNADGTYALVGIVLDDAGGLPITQFTVLAGAAGYRVAQTPITLVRNETVPNVDFALSPSQGVQTFYSDGFEGSFAWQATGFWNRSTLAGVRNQAVPTYVSLAPGDDSNGALPTPIQGTYALWYGQPSTGNFMGPQSPTDFSGSGGTSLAPNQGTVTSPPIVIPANAPAATLRFDTWFEIESVNPNAQGYDIMTIGVIDQGTGGYTELERLNPFVDPTFEPRDAIPFTSGGFNTRPVWRPEFVNLGAYRGKTIRVVFTFSTEDDLYNGFRGWLIDNVSVSDVDVPFGAPALAPPSGGSTSRTERARR